MQLTTCRHCKISALTILSSSDILGKPLLNAAIPLEKLNLVCELDWILLLRVLRNFDLRKATKSIQKFFKHNLQ